MEFSLRHQCARLLNAFFGQIDAGHLHARIDKTTRMPSSATGHIQYRRPGRQLGSFQNGPNPWTRVLLITMAVKQLVVMRTEPILVPGHAFRWTGESTGSAYARSYLCAMRTLAALLCSSMLLYSCTNDDEASDTDATTAVDHMLPVRD